MIRGLRLTIIFMIMIAAVIAVQPRGTAAQQDNPTLPPTATPRGTLPATATEPPSPTNTETPSPTHTPTNSPTATSSPTATNSPTLTDTPTETVSPTATDNPLGPRGYPDGINSLTGLPYPDEDAANRRNLILKVSNFPEVVRPHHGLSQADVVYEYEAEGGVTRFAAIFRSQAPEVVGSIRSARLVDIELVNMYQGILGYSGSNTWIYEFILNEADWRWRAMSPQLGINCPMFCRIRTDNRAFEHTLFANTQAIWQEADRIDVNQPERSYGLAFNEDVPDVDETANDIYINWFNDRANTRWQYNPDDQKYYRWDSGLPHYDVAYDQQISADNVVLIEVWHVDRPDVYESEIGGIALEHQIWGTGTAWVFRDGLWIRGEWFRNQDRGGLYLRYVEDGTPILLKPGQTWIEVVRKQFFGSENELWSVEISDDYTEVEATASAQSAALTAVPAATQTQFAEFYGSPTPSATWTPTPTGTWQR